MLYSVGYKIMEPVRKSKHRSRRSEEHQNTDDRKRSRADMLTRMLIIGLAGSMGLWAFFATLIALHQHRTTKYIRVDIEDLKEAQSEERMEHRHELETVLKELREAEILREQVGQLIQQLVMRDKPPRRFEDVLDRIQKVHNQLTLTSLDQDDLKYIKELLVSLLRNVPLPTANPSGGGPEVRRVLEILAAADAFEASEIDRYLAEVNAKLTAAPGKLPPKPKVEVVHQAPDVKPKPPIQPEPVPEGPQPQPYINKALNFRVLLPPEWTVKDKEVVNGVMAVSPRKNDPSVDNDGKDWKLTPGYAIISATKLKDAAETLGTYTEADFSRIEEYADQYQALDRGEMQLNSGRVKAYYIRYAHNKLSKRWESVKIIAINQDVAYILGFHALQSDYQRDYAEDFARIVASFKLLK
ncbi:MAG: hypothetical protein ACI9TH_005234 [Kiritimatiellia bacterium]|jgi:hypothetical protein